MIKWVQIAPRGPVTGIEFEFQDVDMEKKKKRQDGILDNIRRSQGPLDLAFGSFRNR